MHTHKNAQVPFNEHLVARNIVYGFIVQNSEFDYATCALYKTDPKLPEHLVPRRELEQYACAMGGLSFASSTVSAALPAMAENTKTHFLANIEASGFTFPYYKEKSDPKVSPLSLITTYISAPAPITPSAIVPTPPVYQPPFLQQLNAKLQEAQAQLQAQALDASTSRAPPAKKRAADATLVAPPSRARTTPPAATRAAPPPPADIQPPELKIAPNSPEMMEVDDFPFLNDISDEVFATIQTLATMRKKIIGGRRNLGINN